MKQYQIISRPRHIRYVYFIDAQYSYDKLFDLICVNQSIWGGRFNPIIPVDKNLISEKYITLLKNYDPDYVFYSEGINLEIIKKLGVFNPCEYLKLDEEYRNNNIDGVNSLYFLSKFDKSTNIILTQGLSNTYSPLLSFYKLNYGIENDSLAYEYEIGKYCSQIIINPDNYKSLNEIMFKNKTIIRSKLCRNGINTKILRSQASVSYTDFEIVIAKDKSSTADLLYYWNRLLYEGLNTLYLTVEELEILSKDKYFGYNLFDLSHDQPINVVSNTLTKEEINDLISTKLNPIAYIRTYKFKNISDFPYDVSDANGLFARNFGETTNTQTLITDNGLFYLPKLSYTDEVRFYGQRWAIDIKIKKVGENSYRNEILFPLTTETRYIIKGVSGRVNENRDISIYIHNQQNTTDNLEISIPEFKNLARQLISFPVIDGKITNTKYIQVGLHDASNKLSAFIKSFDFDFSTIEDFFTDTFWVGIFEELITSQKNCGDSISFEEIKSKCIVVLNQSGIELGKREETNYNEENLVFGLKETLKELCYYRVFLKGFKLKCPRCSSKFWYPINNINENVTCFGCLEDFRLPIEPYFAYKLNDLIKINIFQSPKSRDGNLTVIRTLALICDQSRRSFEYAPQINLFDNMDTNKPCSDVDIICISDGKLIIGEAKHNSNEFSANSNKSLISLTELAKNIRPDIVVLSCYEDTKGKLEKAKQALLHYLNGWEHIPEIKTILLSSPDIRNVRGRRYFYH